MTIKNALFSNRTLKINSYIMRKANELFSKSKIFRLNSFNVCVDFDIQSKDKYWSRLFFTTHFNPISSQISPSSSDLVLCRVSRHPLQLLKYFRTSKCESNRTGAITRLTQKDSFEFDSYFRSVPGEDFVCNMCVQWISVHNARQQKWTL